jgi:hypothetical protein
MRANITITLVGIFGVIGLLFLLSFAATETGNNSWALNFALLGFVIVVLVLVLGRRG